MLTATESLAALAHLGSEIGDEIVAAEALALVEQLTRGTLNVLVVGQFKRGKSTVVNALLHEDLMPTGALPLTGIATAVRFGAQARIAVRFYDGTEREIRPQELGSHVTERANPKNRLGVAGVDVIRGAPALRGLSLFDTPGVGSIFAHNTAAARAMLPRTDAAILVVGADPPIGAAELAYAREVAETSVKLFVLLNKADLAGTALDELLDFTREAIAGVAGGDVEIFPVSALRAREAQRAGGEDAAFQRFLTALRAFVDERGAEALEASVRRRAGALANRTEALLLLREQAVSLSQAERAERRAALESALLALDGRVRPLDLLVDDDVRRLRLLLDERLDRRYDAERAAFVERASGIAAESSRRKRNAMVETVLRERAHDWRRDAVSIAERELAACAAKYVRFLGELEQAMIAAGCDALRVDAGAFVPREIAFQPARLTLPVSLDPSTGLEVVRDAVTELLPGRLRRSVLQRRIEQLLETELDALRGKLRYGIAHDLEPWRRSVRATIASSLGATRTAVLQAFPKTEASDEEGTAREDVHAMQKRLRSLRASIDGTLSDALT